ncbi:unnamed protein product, partial [Prorocentrum cordatum]
MSWDIWRTWGRVEMPRRAPPMSVAMLCGIVHVLWRLGRQDAAVLILVAFHCLLRTGELMSIRAEHVLINASRAGLAALPWTESGARRGAQELVTVDDPVVGRALAWLRQRQGAGPLRLGTGAQFRLLFERACVQAGVEEVGLKPYSLRRGGATRDMCTRGDLGRAVHRGRWSDLRTAQIYINDGLAALAQRRVPGTTTTALRQAVRLLGVGARHAAGRPALPLLGDEEGGGGSWVPADDQDLDLHRRRPRRLGGPAAAGALRRASRGRVPRGPARPARPRDGGRRQRRAPAPAVLLRREPRAPVPGGRQLDDAGAGGPRARAKGTVRMPGPRPGLLPGRGSACAPPWPSRAGVCIDRPGPRDPTLREACSIAR